MSQINYAALANKRPDLSGALRKVGDWLETHRNVALVDPRNLARQLSSIGTTELAQSLLLLVQAGLLVQRYKVLTPSGVYADDEFDDPTRIPERLPDRFAQTFETADADIVPVFRRAG